MRKRLIGFLLALCYLSVSLSSFNPTFHQHSDGLSHQCAACAWHSESVSDVPAGPVTAVAPEILVARYLPPELRIVAEAPLLLCARGPPLLS